MAPPSTCISWYFLPSSSTSIITGWKTPGIAAEARRILRKSCSASGLPLAASAPMFQITGRWASRSVVPISSRRPSPYSRAIAANIFSSAYLAMTSASGVVSAMASSNRAAEMPRVR